MPVEELVREYGYWMGFGGTLFQPDATVIAASFLAHRGYLDLSWIFVTALLSTFLESTAYYELVRWKRPAAEAAFSGPSFARISRVINWVGRNGSLTLLLSRFLPGFRMAIVLVCGASRMSRARFFVFNLAGALLWVAVMEGAGYSGGNLYERLAGDVRRHEWRAALVLALVVILLVEFRTRGRVARQVAGILRRTFLGPRP